MSNAFIYQLWNNNLYSIYSTQLSNWYDSGFWNLLVNNVLGSDAFFPVTTILFTMTNLLLVSF